MRSDVAAGAVTTPPVTPAVPPVPPLPVRRRWRRLWPGTGFLDRPGGAEYANRWQASCGQGG